MHAFDGKVVFITGASSGIGRALALDLARFETRLGLFARRAELLDELSREVLEKGAADAISLPGDVKDPEVLKSAVGLVIERWGRVDVAILSAGVGKPANLKRYDLEKIRNTLETNLLGVVNAAGALLPAFRSQGGGVLVGISSLADRRGSPLNLAYCASKAGVTTFLEGLRAGCKREGIRIVTVKPGFVRTPMAEKNQFSMPFLVEPEDAARRILRGVERRKDVIRFPMPMVCLTSLYNRLPNWLFDRIFGR